MTRVVEHLLSKHEALNSNLVPPASPNPTKNPTVHICLAYLKFFASSSSPQIKYAQRNTAHYILYPLVVLTHSPPHTHYQET
jgi:hypothetical protein